MEEEICVICYEPMSESAAASPEQCPMHGLDERSKECGIFNQVHADCLVGWMDKQEQSRDQEFAHCPLCSSQLREPMAENRALARPQAPALPGVQVLPINGVRDLWNLRSTIRDAAAAANMPGDGRMALTMVTGDQGPMLVLIPGANIGEDQQAPEMAAQRETVQQMLQEAVLQAQIAAIDAATERHEQQQRQQQCPTTSRRCAIM